MALKHVSKLFLTFKFMYRDPPKVIRGFYSPSSCIKDILGKETYWVFHNGKNLPLDQNLGSLNLENDSLFEVRE